MSTTTDTARLHQRVAAADWTELAEELDTHGWALTPRLLTPAQCARIAGLYERDERFRSTIDMARHASAPASTATSPMTCPNRSPSCAPRSIRGC